MSSKSPPRTDLAALTARIREEFPDFEFTKVTLDDSGDDHHVLIADDAVVFRFPRFGGEQLGLFAAERRLLAALAGRTPFAIPDYVHLARDETFGGYPLIRGKALRPRLFAALAPAARAEIAGQVAAFLRLAHALPAATIARADGAIAREWIGRQFHARWVDSRRALVAPFAPAGLMTRLDSFYTRLAATPPPAREVVTHGDLSDDHMLLGPDGGRLAGVIDFADACLGDPAFDLTFFFAYGEDIARDLVARYDPDGGDPGLIERARKQYVRFRAEGLRRLASERGEDGEAIRAEIARHLSAMGL